MPSFHKSLPSEISCYFTFYFLQSARDSSQLLVIFFLAGFGVFMTRKFRQGDFPLAYAGDVITEDEAQKREKYEKQKKGIYIFYFHTNGIKHW